MTARLIPLLLAALLVLPIAATAQDTFTLDFPETQIIEDTLGDLFIYHGVLTNTTDDERIYALEYVVDDSELPGEWTFQWCTHYTCFAPFLTTVEDTLDPGQVDDILSVDIGAWTDTGYANVKTRIYDVEFPDDYVETWFTLADPTDAPEPVVVSRPASHELGTVYPNPFNAAANVRFTLAAPADARLTLHDVTGRQVMELARGMMPAGQHVRTLNARTLPSGTYFVRMATNEQTFVQPITLVK